MFLEGEPAAPAVDLRVLGVMLWTGGTQLSWARRNGAPTPGLHRYRVTGLPWVGYAIPQALGCAVGRPPDALVVEAAFVHRNAKTGLHIARTAGRIDAGIQLALKVPLPCREVLPSAWRTAIGLPTAADREEAKALALLHVPTLLPDLVPYLDLLGRDCDHIADAAGIALAGMRYSAWDVKLWAQVEATHRARHRSRRRKKT